MTFIKEISTTNLGPIPSLTWSSLGGINILIGPNQSGKTMLLKALFASLKTIELYKRGKENRTDKQILSDKLYWTYQANNLSSIVKKRESSATFTLKGCSDHQFTFSIGKYAEKEASIDKNTFPTRSSNSIFIPAKEIMSLKDIIIESRDNQDFGFEEPYYDLAKALGRTQKGNNYKSFSEARQVVMNMVGGRLEYVDQKKEWQFRDKDRRLYEIGIMSEGVKKLSILDLLLGNHYLDDNSVIIIDEIEANLHPSMITRFLQIIYALSQTGVQFFIASHSYFVIKRLYIMAHQNDMSVPVLSFDDDTYTVSDLRDEMPNNPIIDESISLYKDEIRL